MKKPKFKEFMFCFDRKINQLHISRKLNFFEDTKLLKEKAAFYWMLKRKEHWTSLGNEFRMIIQIKKNRMPTSGVGPPTFRLQGERNNHYATQAYISLNSMWYPRDYSMKSLEINNSYIFVHIISIIKSF